MEKNKNCTFHLLLLVTYHPIEKLSKLILFLYSLGDILLKRNLALLSFQPFNSLTKKYFSTISQGTGEEAS